MNKDKEIIQGLLKIIEYYDNNKIAKNMPLLCYQENDYTILIEIATKGDANKGTPFYFGNMSTYIIKEYWVNNKIAHAEILHQIEEGF